MRIVRFTGCIVAFATTLLGAAAVVISASSCLGSGFGADFGAALAVSPGSVIDLEGVVFAAVLFAGAAAFTAGFSSAFAADFAAALAAGLAAGFETGFAAGFAVGFETGFAAGFGAGADGVSSPGSVIDFIGADDEGADGVDGLSSGSDIDFSGLAVGRSFETAEEAEGAGALGLGAGGFADGIVPRGESSITNPLMVSRSSVDSSERILEESAHSEAELLI